MRKLCAAAILAVLISQVAYGQQGNGPLTKPDANVVKAHDAAKAIKAQENIIVWSEAELIRDMDVFLDGIGKLTPELEKMTAVKIREVAVKLHGMGLKLLAFHKQYETSNKSLVSSYAQAPAAFRGAAASYRRFAKEEPYEEIKADYLRLAEICDANAVRYEKRAAGLPGEAKEVRETMKFVERTVIYLERHDVLTAAFPDLSVGEDRARFLELLKGYVEGYKGFRGNLQKYHEKLKEQAMEAKVLPTSAEAVIHSNRKDSPTVSVRDGIGRTDGAPLILAALLVSASNK